MLDCLMRFDEDWGGCGIIEEIIARKNMSDGELGVKPGEVRFVEVKGVSIAVRVPDKVFGHFCSRRIGRSMNKRRGHETRRVSGEGFGRWWRFMKRQWDDTCFVRMVRNFGKLRGMI